MSKELTKQELTTFADFIINWCNLIEVKKTNTGVGFDYFQYWVVIKGTAFADPTNPESEDYDYNIQYAITKEQYELCERVIKKMKENE